MKDKYWWLKSNGEVWQIQREEYHRLSRLKGRLLAKTYGKQSIVFLQENNVIFLKKEQIDKIFLNR